MGHGVGQVVFQLKQGAATPALLKIQCGSNPLRHGSDIFDEKLQKRPKPEDFSLFWSWRWDLNPRPIDYESIALPLRHSSIFNFKNGQSGSYESAALPTEPLQQITQPNFQLSNNKYDTEKSAFRQEAIAQNRRDVIK